MSLVEQELLTLLEHLSSSPVFGEVRVTRSLVLCVCFVDRFLSICTFFFWPLRCLFFFEIRILITPLVSSHSSYNCRASFPLLLSMVVTTLLQMMININIQTPTLLPLVSEHRKGKTNVNQFKKRQTLGQKIIEEAKTNNNQHEQSLKTKDEQYRCITNQ